MSEVMIRNARVDDAETIQSLICLAYDFDPSNPGDYAVPASAVRRMVSRFPEGQFVAVVDDRVVGFAITIRTRRTPDAPPLSWVDAVGTKALNRHHPAGDWIYGVDFAVHPDYRRLGIGTALYRARFAMIKHLNLRGFYSGGMLAGYPDYASRMTVAEYGTAVQRREIIDPTITMQMNRGFEPVAVIEHYAGDSVHMNAMLIVWRNPEYQTAARLQRTTQPAHAEPAL